MSFVTIPDSKNVPILLNIDHIQYVGYKEFDTLEIVLVSGAKVLTKVPRQILVDIINKQSKVPEPVQPTTEWAG